MAARGVTGVSSDLVTTGRQFVPIIEAPPTAEQNTAETAPRVPEIEIDFGGTVVRVATGIEAKTFTRFCARCERPLHDDNPIRCEDHASAFGLRRAAVLVTSVELADLWSLSLDSRGMHF